MSSPNQNRERKCVNKACVQPSRQCGLLAHELEPAEVSDGGGKLGSHPPGQTSRSSGVTRVRWEDDILPAAERALETAPTISPPSSVSGTHRHTAVSLHASSGNSPQGSLGHGTPRPSPFQGSCLLPQEGDMNIRMLRILN